MEGGGTQLFSVLWHTTHHKRIMCQEINTRDDGPFAARWYVMVQLESGRVVSSVVGVAAACLWYNLAGGVKPEIAADPNGKKKDKC
jgi:hypothetical protein